MSLSLAFPDFVKFLIEEIKPVPSKRGNVILTRFNVTVKIQDTLLCSWYGALAGVRKDGTPWAWPPKDPSNPFKQCEWSKATESAVLWELKRLGELGDKRSI